MLETFEPSLEGLQDALPHWWAKEAPAALAGAGAYPGGLYGDGEYGEAVYGGDVVETTGPASELYILLSALASAIDWIAVEYERIQANASVETADLEGLTNGLAYVLGVPQEEFPLGLEALRAYLLARMAEDGSLESLETTLLALLLTDVNLSGTELVFPGSGGLTFPADGSGLALYQATVSTRAGLIFPADGSGITFPDQGLTFAADGSGITIDSAFPDEPDLTFPTVGYLLITEHPADYYFTVTVKSYLAFDRPAFKRAIGRFRFSHLLPAVYEETAP